MTTLNVKIDKQSRQKYKLQENEITFDVLRRRIISAEGLTALKKASRAAKRTSLAKTTTTEIEKEIRAARNAKNRS